MIAKRIPMGLFYILNFSFLRCTMGTADTVETGNRASQQSWLPIATPKGGFKLAVIHEISDTPVSIYGTRKYF